jgi:hypothetical protein
MCHRSNASLRGAFAAIAGACLALAACVGAEPSVPGTSGDAGADADATALVVTGETGVPDAAVAEGEADSGADADATVDEGARESGGDSAADATLGSALDSALDSGPDAMSKSDGCAAADLLCDGGCVANDPHNCGTCGNSCSGGATCDAGACGCTPGAHDCGGTCVSNAAVASCGTSSCAACPVPSGGSATCDGTSCGTSCPGGTSLCGSACVDTTSDKNNCGACSHGCLGGSCLSSQCQPVLLGGDSTGNDVTAYALDATNIYWAELANGGAIVKCPITSGCQSGAIPVLSGGINGGETFSIAVDGTNVYWTDPTNEVAMCPITGCTSRTTFYAPTQDAGYTETPNVVKVDATKVYFSQLNASGSTIKDWYIYACPKSGCPATGASLIAQMPSTSRDFTVGAGFVYTDVSSPAPDGGVIDTLLKCSTNGCSNTPTTLLTMAGPSSSFGPIVGGEIAADSANVYWEDQGNNAIYQCSATGCTTPITLSTSVGGFVVVDSANVYFGANGSVESCAIGGCGQKPASLAQGLSGPGVIGVDSSAVYFFDSAQNVYKIAK